MEGESPKKQSRIQKYPDTCGRGLISIFYYFIDPYLPQFLHIVGQKLYKLINVVQETAK